MRNENEGLHRREHRKKKKFNDGKDVRKWNHKAYTNERDMMCPAGNPLSIQHRQK